MKARIILSAIYLTISSASVFGQLSDENPDAEDIDDKDVRENPVIDFGDYETEVEIPSFIKLKANKIEYNGADWSSLRQKLEHSSELPVNIVHIGDSHLQADLATSVVRENLQFDYGNAGRGIITPLKMSGTNEPLDYAFTSTNAWNAVKLMSSSWPRTMGFTGTSITPISSSSNFLVSTSEKEDYNPFSAITVFHKGQFYVTGVDDADGNHIPFLATPSKDYTEIVLTEDVNAARIYFDSSADLTIFGASLSGQRPGVFYHVIGNNGATYATYNRIGNVGEGISVLKPALVIISLGTNEAFGILDKKRFKESISQLVENIRAANPEAKLLLVTPMECQRSQRTKSGKSYYANQNVAVARDVILDFARHNHIAVYDWFNVAGGNKASEKWIADGLFSRDRVHHSMKGYILQGELLYMALRNALKI